MLRLAGERRASAYMQRMTDQLEILTEDEVTRLLARRYRLFLRCGWDWKQALLLAVALA